MYLLTIVRKMMMCWFWGCYFSDTLLNDSIDHARSGLSISKDLIAWAGKGNISIYNLTSDRFIFVDHSIGNDPIINNNRLAYMDLSHANKTRGTIRVSYIYYINTGEKIQIKNITEPDYFGEQLHPSIYGDWVVWYNTAVCESWLEKNFYVLSLSSLLIICLIVTALYVRKKKKAGV